LQKSKLIDPIEMEVLFSKADRFLSKESFKKEKDKIKIEI
jgi:hypothetical protein